MFRLELHELLFAYTGLCLAVMLLAAVLHNVRRNHRETLAHRNIMKCQLCGFEFRDNIGADLPKCPCCSSLVNRERISQL